MNVDHPWLHKVLRRKLRSAGLEEKTVPRVVKDLMLFFSGDPSMQRSEMNRKLQVLGWDDVEIDYRTWELARETYEAKNRRE
jgi:serine protease inhibitor ecotin